MKDIQATAAGLNLPGDPASLSSMVAQHPWFTTARLVREAAGNGKDPYLELYLLTNPRPWDPSLVTDFSDAKPASVPENGASPIDRFIMIGDYRIVPDESVGEYDAAQESATLDIPDELATEELAKIYMDQGLTEQAEAIYSKIRKGK